MKTVTLAPTARTQRRLNVRRNARLQALANATPAEIDAYLTANMTNLAEARQIVSALAVAISYLLKQAGE